MALTATLGFAATPAAAAAVGPLVRVSDGDPFAKCNPGNAGVPAGTNYPATEIEPYVIADPLNPDNLLAGWQQDRWSNGGSRGLVAGVSKNGPCCPVGPPSTLTTALFKPGPVPNPILVSDPEPAVTVARRMPSPIRATST